MFVNGNTAGSDFRLVSGTVSHGRTGSVGHCRVSGRILCRHTGQAFQLFCHANFQIVAAVRYDTKVVFCGQLAFIRNTADYIHLFIQFLLDDSSCITAVLHAVAHGCHFMGDTVLVFINDAGHAICPVISIRAVDTVRSGSRFHGETVLSVFAIQTDRTVFAVDHYGRTVFTVNSDGAVFAVGPCLTEHQVIIHIDFVRIVSSAIAFHGGILTVFQDRLSCRNNIFQLSEVYCITVICAGCYVSNLLIVRIETGVIDVGLSAYMHAVIVDNNFICSRACRHFRKLRLFTHHQVKAVSCRIFLYAQILA